MLWRARRSRLDVSPAFEPRKPMRSARMESSVMRMIFGLVVARAGIADRAMTATRSAADILRNMVSVYRRDREDGLTRASRPRPHSHLISTIMEARITAYLALHINPESCPLPAGVCCRCAADFLPAAKMAWRSKARHSWH